MWTEKRDSVRVEIECPITYVCLKKALMVFTKKTKATNAMMVKPSMMGLRIVGAEDVPANTKLQINVEMKKLGYSRPYLLSGIVVWSSFSGKTKSFEQGVKIFDSSPDWKPWRKFILEQLKSTDRFSKSQTFNNK